MAAAVPPSIARDPSTTLIGSLFYIFLLKNHMGGESKGGEMKGCEMKVVFTAMDVCWG